jgi:hypothetical protein
MPSEPTPGGSGWLSVAKLGTYPGAGNHTRVGSSGEHVGNGPGVRFQATPPPAGDQNFGMRNVLLIIALPLAAYISASG